eukprot:2977852-Pyramimonas_sp.AAC.2
MSHRLARRERQCYTNVTPPGQRRAGVLHKCHTPGSTPAPSAPLSSPAPLAALTTPTAPSAPMASELKRTSTNQTQEVRVYSHQGPISRTRQASPSIRSMVTNSYLLRT